MAKRPNTLNLLAKLRREHEFWELYRVFSRYFCRIWESGRVFKGHGDLMGEAIQEALEGVKSWRGCAEQSGNSRRKTAKTARRADQRRYEKTRKGTKTKTKE